MIHPQLNLNIFPALVLLVVVLVEAWAIIQVGEEETLACIYYYIYPEEEEEEKGGKLGGDSQSRLR